MGCDYDVGDIVTNKLISIHAPIVGCDAATKRDQAKLIWISIHAPIVGCDLKPVYTLQDKM